jgi:Zn-dependent protease with chaperone function
MVNPTSQKTGRSSPARQWLLIVAMFAVCRLPVLCGALVLVVAAAAFQMWYLIVAPVALVLLATLRSISDREAPPGMVVRPDDEPELAAMVRDIADRTGFGRPLLVRVVAHPQAALGPERISGVGSRVLLLGLPLLRAMTATQLASVIAHELAHEHDAGNRRNTWLTLARGELTEKLNGSLRPPARLARGLLRISQPLCWDSEFAADRAAVLVTGRSAVRSALELSDPLDAAFEHLGDKYLDRLAEDDSYPVDFYDALDAALADPATYCRAARAAAEDAADDPFSAASHPPLTDRVAALPEEDGVAEYGDRPVVLRDARPIEEWCLRQLTGLGIHDLGIHDLGGRDSVGEAGAGTGREGDGLLPVGTADSTTDADRTDDDTTGTEPETHSGYSTAPPRPVRLLELGLEQVHSAEEAEEKARTLRLATRQESTEQALLVAGGAIADGSWPDLAQRLEPRLRRIPAAARPLPSRIVLTGAMAAALVTELRSVGWQYADRWSIGVLAAPDGTVHVLHDLLTTALDSGDPGPVHALLGTTLTKVTR